MKVICDCGKEIRPCGEESDGSTRFTCACGLIYFVFDEDSHKALAEYFRDAFYEAAAFRRGG